MAVTKEWPHLKSWMRKVYNKEVNEWFRDGDDEDPDNSTGRNSTKRSCLILPGDSQNISLLKIMNFRYSVQKVHLRPDVYGIPIAEYQESVSFKPQIQLFFRQDKASVPEDRTPVESEFSFRIINETSATFTEAKARTWATKIKNEFAQGGGYILKKGKIKISIKDMENGLNSFILTLNESEGIEFIRKIYNLIDKHYDENKIFINTPKKDSINNPVGTDLVFGERKRKRRWRPTANTRFRYATLHLGGRDTPVYLVDRTGRHPQAFEYI